MNRSATSHLLWILAAAVLGFSSAYVFGDLLRIPRRWFLVPHVTVTVSFLVAYARWSGTSWRRLARRNSALGSLTCAAVSVFLIVNVSRQPASAAPTGLALWVDLVWLGLVYGAVDALLLSVLPLVATWRSARLLGWTARLRGRIAAAALGLAASAFVTSAYHLGHAEFRGPALAKAITGNAIMSAGQIASGSPIASVGSHVAMHIAAVLHGPDTTVQLPPHSQLGASQQRGE